jgi:hypothetical protein
VGGRFRVDEIATCARSKAHDAHVSVHGRLQGDPERLAIATNHGMGAGAGSKTNWAARKGPSSHLPPFRPGSMRAAPVSCFPQPRCGQEAALAGVRRAAVTHLHCLASSARAMLPGDFERGNEPMASHDSSFEVEANPSTAYSFTMQLASSTFVGFGFAII